MWCFGSHSIGGMVVVIVCLGQAHGDEHLVWYKSYSCGYLGTA